MSSTHPHPALKESADYALTAAQIVAHPRNLPSQDARADTYRTAILERREISPPQAGLASAAAAATLANAHSHRLSVESHPRPRTYPVADIDLNHRLSAKAALLAMCDHPSPSLAKTSEAQGSKEPRAKQQQPEDTFNPLARQAALDALIGGSQRAESTVTAGTEGLLPDLAPALLAATSNQKAMKQGESAHEREAQRANSSRVPGFDTAMVQRDIYTSHPPLSIDIDERTQQETRKAAVISMAKQIYAVMPTAESLAAAEVSSLTSERQRRRPPLSAAAGPQPQPQPCPSAASQEQVRNLYAVAENRASQDISKLDDQIIIPAARTIRQATSAPLHRPAARARRRTWSSGTTSITDLGQRYTLGKHFQRRSTGHTTEMDGDLMAIARSNVKATMATIDQHISGTSGKPSPTTIQDWERRAYERAKSTTGRGATTATFVPGREEKLAGQRDIEELARERIKPTMKRIYDEAYEYQGRELVQRLDAEHEQEYLERDKQRKLEVKKAEKKVEKMFKNRAKSKTKTNPKVRIGGKTKTAEEKTKMKAQKDEKRSRKDERKAAKMRQENGSDEEPPTAENRKLHKKRSRPGGIIKFSGFRNTRKEREPVQTDQSRSQEEVQVEPNCIAPAEQLDTEPASATPAGASTGAREPTATKRRWVLFSHRRKSTTGAKRRETHHNDIPEGPGVSVGEVTCSGRSEIDMPVPLHAGPSLATETSTAERTTDVAAPIAAEEEDRGRDNTAPAPAPATFTPSPPTAPNQEPPGRVTPPTSERQDRQWKTSPSPSFGRKRVSLFKSSRGSEAKDHIPSEKQRHFLKSLFKPSHSRGISGTQGSFTVLQRPEISTVTGDNPVTESAPQLLSSRATGQTARWSRFQEEI